MIKDVIVERIPVEDGTLIINRRYMALQTPDGVLHPADMMSMDGFCLFGN